MKVEGDRRNYMTREEEINKLVEPDDEILTLYKSIKESYSIVTRKG